MFLNFDKLILYSVFFFKVSFPNSIFSKCLLNFSTLDFYLFSSFNFCRSNFLKYPLNKKLCFKASKFSFKRILPSLIFFTVESILLTKIVSGDSSDNIPSIFVKKITTKKKKELIENENAENDKAFEKLKKKVNKLYIFQKTIMYS